MAAQAFLKIDGIKGESTDAKHAGEIDVESFSWGVSQSGSAAVAGGAGAGKASVSDFSFMTRSTTASPQLFLACASGKHLKSAVFTARRAGAAPVEFLKITFTDVLISSYQESGSSGDDGPYDSLSFNSAKIKFEFAPIRAKGTAGRGCPPVGIRRPTRSSDPHTGSSSPCSTRRRTMVTDAEAMSPTLVSCSVASIASSSRSGRCPSQRARSRAPEGSIVPL